MMTEPLDLPISELSELVQTGAVSALELTERCLARIQARARLNAFISVRPELALQAARDVDAKRGRGERLGSLAGIPIAVKDALCTSDLPTTAGSKMLLRQADALGSGTAWQPPYDATAVERLRQADAIVIGKTNLDEFAMGSSNENSAFGPVDNPRLPGCTPGGSSGGSAAAVAAGLAPGSLGSDTGGSVRQPAAFCGVVGLKPTYGRVSRFGLIAFGSSLDQIGPLGRDVRGVARLLRVIAGRDPRDATSATQPLDDYEAACKVLGKPPIVGVPSEYFAEGIDPRVRRRVEQAIRTLAELGCEIRDIRLPHTRYGIAAYYVLATAEASSNLARFDGVRFGLREEAAGADLQQMYAQTRGRGFGKEVKRRIMLGAYVLSAGYYEAYYGKASRVRELIRRDFVDAFAEVDVIATPSAPTPPFELGEKVADPLQMYLADVFTLPASLAGICGISVPCAPSDDDATPVGLQLLRAPFEEAKLCSLAAAFERARGPL
jgi:aspartyl-tRNA(Asn)/glutamyl-tRNA(Gln) amidotransferase subunit A